MMNKNLIRVPKGVRYLSEWTDFKLPEGACSMNKQIPGCGFTEYCLKSDKFDFILVRLSDLMAYELQQRDYNSRFSYATGISFLMGLVPRLPIKKR